MTRDQDWKRISAMAGVDENGSILPETGGKISPNTWWRNGAMSEDAGPDMPIAEAREWLQEIRSKYQAYLKADVEAKLGYADRHRKRIAALDAALKAIDLLAEG